MLSKCADGTWESRGKHGQATIKKAEMFLSTDASIHADAHEIARKWARAEHQRVMRRAKRATRRAR